MQHKSRQPFTENLPLHLAKSCKTCIARSESGRCHMNPMVVFAFNFGAGEAKIGWPVCPLDGWCMQHQPKPSEAKKETKLETMEENV